MRVILREERFERAAQQGFVSVQGFEEGDLRPSTLVTGNLHLAIFFVFAKTMQKCGAYECLSIPSEGDGRAKDCCEEGRC
ncbi:hypothetical protein AA106556_1150 [Neokomagataea tanensis NBRC 106556]|uniref:Uncharacterized protein n=1 Tax=Neokomagataea tanensis NBRC 106556 TaxID=1223519 RepID=A0ABQ0QJ27_9PROT|nr:hypothetical protein AA106556_1150 [Neokomagataea tanensis NBRC 106556]